MRREGRTAARAQSLAIWASLQASRLEGGEGSPLNKRSSVILAEVPAQPEETPRQVATPLIPPDSPEALQTPSLLGFPLLFLISHLSPSQPHAAKCDSKNFQAESENILNFKVFI